MKALFKTEDELGTQQHANAENSTPFDDLARYGSVSILNQGIAPHSINPHAETMDPYSTTIYAGLSIQSSTGLTSSKVSKRKSRASRKPPIKVFSADTSNFMAMVHKLTGFQSSAYLLAGSPQASLLKPLATGPLPLHPFAQGVYMPDSPAGEKMAANFSNDTFSCTLSQRMSAHSARQQLDSNNDGSLSTKEGFSRLNSSSRTDDTFPPCSHNPAFEALHLQVSKNGNGWDSCRAVLSPSQGDPMNEDCRKEQNCLNLFNEQRMLREDIGTVRH